MSDYRHQLNADKPKLSQWNSNLAAGNQSVFIVHRLLTVLEDVKKVFDIEINKDNIILTEKEIKDAKGIQFHD